MHSIKESDPQIDRIVQNEENRQNTSINLIASENIAHPEVLESLGSCLTNKYAEGYPGKRYYSGCQYVDEVELLALERCKTLFHAEHANVQPHSGTSANMAVYLAVLKPGDTILGMGLASGGHLTHGSNVSFSGMLYKSVSYDVDSQTELIDYQHVELIAQQHKPKLIIAGASSYSRIIDIQKFQYIAHSINAYLLIDCAHTAGLIAAGLYPHPFPYADFITATTHKTLRGPRGGFILCKKNYQELIDRAVFPGMQGGPAMNAIAGKAIAFKFAAEPAFKEYQQQALRNAQSMVNTFKQLGYRIVSDGTDLHFFVLDLTNHAITGRQAELMLEKEGISVSRSLIPADTQKPWITSGIRMGTLAMTTRGYKEQQAESAAVLIDSILKGKNVLCPPE